MIGVGMGLWRRFKASITDLLGFVPTIWLDATEMYAKSKIAVDSSGTGTLVCPDGLHEFTDMTQAMSISFWINPNAVSGYVLRTSQLNIVYSASLIFEFQGSSGYASVDSRNSAVSPTVGVWQHFVWTYDGTYNTNGMDAFQLFVDGSADIAYDRTDTHSGSLGTYASHALFASVLTASHNGILDQWCVFDKALSQTEANALYASNAGLNHKDLAGSETFYNNIVAWYDFNVPTNFGKNYNGQSHAVDLDGTQYFTIPTADSTDFAFEYNEPFSIGCWVRTDAIGNQSVMARMEGAPNYRGWQLVLRNTDEIRFNMLHNTTNEFYIDTTDANLVAGQWYHIVVTYNGNGLASGVTFYVNGASKSTNIPKDNLLSNTTVGSVDFRLGYNWNSGGDLTFDEVFIYGDELTSGEVTTLYNGGTVAEASTLHTDNLLSSWSFDEDFANIGSDKYGINDLDKAPAASIGEADLVGGKDSLDLTEVGISSANAVLGHIEGNAAGFDGVTKWTDRSTFGNNMLQATLTECPIWQTGDLVRFTGDNHLDSTSPLDLSGAFTIVLRCKHSDVTELCDLLSTSTVVYSNDATGKPSVLGVTATTALTNNTYATISVKCTGGPSVGTIFFRKDGVADGSGTRIGVVSSANLRIGNIITQSQNWDLKGLWIKQIAMSDADIESIENHFNSL